MPVTDKQQAFIQEYCSNGYNASKAYVSAGYSSVNADGNAHRLIVKDSIKAEIAKVRAKSVEKAERTVQSIDVMQQTAYDLALRLNQPSAAVSAGTAIARLYGMDKDAGTSGKDIPKPLSDKDLALLKAMAKTITEQELEQKPTIKLHTA